MSSASWSKSSRCFFVTFLGTTTFTCTNMSPRLSLRELRHAEAAHAHDLLVLAALGDAHLHLLVLEDAVDLDLGAERRLHDGHVRARMQVVAVALEELVGLDAHGDDEVARRGALHARLAEAAKGAAAGESRMPTGTSTDTRWRSGTRPWPSHSGQGLSMDVPVPPQVLHVVADCMSPRNGVLHGDHAALAVAVRDR